MKTKTETKQKHFLNIQKNIYIFVLNKTKIINFILHIVSFFETHSIINILWIIVYEFVWMNPIKCVGSETTKNCIIKCASVILSGWLKFLEVHINITTNLWMWYLIYFEIINLMRLGWPIAFHFYIEVFFQNMYKITKSPVPHNIWHNWNSMKIFSTTTNFFNNNTVMWINVDSGIKVRI